MGVNVSRVPLRTHARRRRVRRHRRRGVQPLDHAAVGRRPDGRRRLDRDRARDLRFLATDTLPRRRLLLRRVHGAAVRAAGPRHHALRRSCSRCSPTSRRSLHSCSCRRAPRACASARRARSASRTCAKRRARPRGVEEGVVVRVVDAVGGIERNADATGPQRVARLGQPFDLFERVHRETARAIEPEFVACSRERLEERVAVAGGAVADPRAFVEVHRTDVPGQFGAFDEQILVEVVGRADDDSGRAGAPLHANLPIRSGQRRAVTRRPVREAVLDDGRPRQDGIRLALELTSASRVEQRAAGSARCRRRRAAASALSPPGRTAGRSRAHRPRAATKPPQPCHGRPSASGHLRSTRA